MSYRIQLGTTTGISTVTATLFSPDIRVKSWSKRINAPGRMVFSMHKANAKATETNLRPYRRVRLLRKTRDGTATYEAVWLGYIEAVKQVEDEIEALCMGMLQLFKKRYTGAAETFNGQGSTEAFDLLTAANATGATGIAGGTGGVTSTRSLTMDSKEMLSAWEELARAHGAEFEIDEDGAFNFVSALGTDQSSVIMLTYRQDGAPGTNLNTIEWGEDGKDMANKVIGITSAGGGLTSTDDDETSQTTYGVLVERKTFDEAQAQGTLDSMTTAYLTQRANPLTDLIVEPSLASQTYNPLTNERTVTGIQYDDVSLGDLISVNIITPNRTVSTTKRIAEVSVDVDENLNERMRLTLSASGVFITAAYLDAHTIDDVKRRIKELEAAA